MKSTHFILSIVASSLLILSINLDAMAGDFTFGTSRRVTSATTRTTSRFGKKQFLSIKKPSFSPIPIFLQSSPVQPGSCASRSSGIITSETVNNSAYSPASKGVNTDIAVSGGGDANVASPEIASPKKVTFIDASDGNAKLKSENEHCEDDSDAEKEPPMTASRDNDLTSEAVIVDRSESLAYQGDLQNDDSDIDEETEMACNNYANSMDAFWLLDNSLTTIKSGIAWARKSNISPICTTTAKKEMTDALHKLLQRNSDDLKNNFQKINARRELLCGIQAQLEKTNFLINNLQVLQKNIKRLEASRSIMKNKHVPLDETDLRDFNNACQVQQNERIKTLGLHVAITLHEMERTESMRSRIYKKSLDHTRIHHEPQKINIEAIFDQLKTNPALQTTDPEAEIDNCI